MYPFCSHLVFSKREAHITCLVQLRYNLHSFGIGSRKCMGQYVATHIVKALVVHLFKEYEVVISKEGQGGEGRYAIDKSSWTPKAGVCLRLTRRQASVL